MASSKTTLPFAYPWTELHQTRFLGLLQAISPESGVGSGNILVLPDYPNFAPWSNFWRFFGRLQDDAALRLPLDRIAPNSVSWAFAGHFTGIGCWKRKHTSITRLPQFCSLEQLLAFFRPTPRRRCPALTPGPNCTKLGFLCFCRPFHRNRVLEAETYQYYQITPILLPGATFGVFSADSKTTLSCAYPWTELHQTRFPVFLQAIPPESSVGNEKTPLLADWHGFGVFLAFFRLAPRRRCPSLTPGPNCTKLGFLCFCRPFHLNRALETRRHHY